MKISSSPETLRHLSCGEVVGFHAPNGVHVWRGIPYAASTHGKNRWRAPQPVCSWTGVRSALKFADRCAQLATRFDSESGLKPGQFVGSEDCLALDIYTPSNAKGRNLPVMVWIHGGANVWGWSGDYDGSALAHNGDVCVVIVQYRLGPLGWFANESLRQTATTNVDRAANFAILDLIASLNWVQNNIENFGGNADNVTVFGQSAGGHNVATLLASPLARGLFHRAIVQSGCFDSISIKDAENGIEGLFSGCNQVVAKLGDLSAKELRKVPVQQLLSLYKNGRGGFIDAPKVIEDGVVLPMSSLYDVFSDPKGFHQVPVMLGTNRDEMKLFYFSNPQYVKRKCKFLYSAIDPQFYDIITDYLSRIWRIRAVLEPATKMTTAGLNSIYAYQFNWDESGKFLSTDLKQLLGAAHGMEIPFVFGRFPDQNSGGRVAYPRKNRDEREGLSWIMNNYWTRFARDGVPTCEYQPEWKPFGSDQNSLNFDDSNEGGLSVEFDNDSIDKVTLDLNNDSRITSEQHQLIITEMKKWMNTRPVWQQLQN